MIAPDASAPPIANAAGSPAHAGSRPAIAPTGSAKIVAPRSASLAASVAPYAINTNAGSVTPMVAHSIEPVLPVLERWKRARSPPLIAHASPTTDSTSMAPPTTGNHGPS